jgi:putative component of toxin-antitoxin plasmid stabilization module
MNKKRVIGIILMILSIAPIFSNFLITGHSISITDLTSKNLIFVAFFFIGVFLFTREESKTKNKLEKIVISSKVKEDPTLLRLARETGENQDAAKDINHLIFQLKKGDKSPGLGTKPVFKGVYELRAKNGGRVYYQRVGNKYEILAYSDKDNQPQVINRLVELYDKKS